MKKIFLILSLVALLLVTGCSKEKRCQCTYDRLDAHNRPAVTYVHVKSGFKCSGITKLGYERLKDGQLVRELEDVVCEEATD